MYVSGCSGSPKMRRGLSCSFSTSCCMLNRPSDTACSSSGSMNSMLGNPGGGFGKHLSSKVWGAKIVFLAKGKLFLKGLYSSCCYHDLSRSSQYRQCVATTHRSPRALMQAEVEPHETPPANRPL